MFLLYQEEQAGFRREGAQMSEEKKDSDTSEKDYKVGDVVQFKGGPHYVSSSSGSPAGNPKAGPARITIIAKGAKHPYHLIHTDSSSWVYGWVDSGMFN